MSYLRFSSSLSTLLRKRNVTGPPLSCLFSMVCVTAPEEKIAKDLARELLKKQIAACVNIAPKIYSLYIWKGEVCENSEVLMLIKTRTCRVKDVVECVRDYHPYEVSEVIAFKISEGSKEYLQWIEDVVPPD